MRTPYKKGFVLGKFMPFHLGHKLMIDGAADMCEEVVVLVSGGKDIPKNDRIAHLKDHYVLHRNVSIVEDTSFDALEPQEVDEHGTATCDIFWKDWITAMDDFFDDSHKFDAVFTNDAYGERLARELEADWVPLDRDRQVVPISGTDIRNNPAMHYHMLTAQAKNWFHRTVAVVGPESTGKSTLTKKLAKQFNAGYVPEFGRTLSEVKGNKLDEDDFRTISFGQNALLSAAHEQHRLVFADTESYTTRYFADMYLSYPIPDNSNTVWQINHELDNAALTDQYDLYILLAPTVPWVDDGTRIMSQDKREEFFRMMEKFLCDFNRKYVIINDEYWAGRTAHAIKAVQDNWRIL